jgi:subtilisin family serine protease
MQRLKNLVVPILVLALAALALVAFPSITSSQNRRPRGPQTKFRKVANAIANRYLVLLNDDVARDNEPREVRLERVTEIANSHALAHAGKVDYIYETALKGYAIELPNEAAAIAISRMPEVQWVEEDQALQPLQVPASPQASPPWGLDAVDGNLPAPTPDATGRTNGSYIFHGDGTGVNAYVIDTGINTQHNEFAPPPFSSQATQAADCIRSVNCLPGGAASGFTDQFCGPNQGTNNFTNNDCAGHGTHVAAILGGDTYGVAKRVNIRSVKVCVTNFSFGIICPASAVVQGVNWVTNQHTTDSSVPKVVNMSLGAPGNTNDNAMVDVAVSNSINSGVTYVIAAGNSNVDARTFHPAAVEPALTVGAVDWTASRWVHNASTGSNLGPGIDLFAPGVFVVSAQTGQAGGPLGDCQFWNGTNTDECRDSGTSMAAPHVAGAVAIYLQNRTGLSNCSPFPITGRAPQQAANLSTCPDRIARYIKANAILDRLTNLNGTDASGQPITSPNRFLASQTVPTAPNPIESHRFFVWGLYADMLNREPDNGGLQFHVNQIQTCQGNAECLKTMRGIVAANFVRSPEFGGKGGYIANLFNIVFGQRPKTPGELSDPNKVERPNFNEFIADMNLLPGPDALVSAQKTALALNWLGRPEVQAILPSNLSPADFVTRLENKAGVTLANRQALINQLTANNTIQTRASVLRAVAESPEVTDKFTLQNFVTMQYIGHLRREPEDCHGSPDPANCGYIFHYNRFGGGDSGAIQNAITQGFIESPEYRRRFGP